LAPVSATTVTPPEPRGRRLRVGPSVGLLPFLVYILVCLLVPTITVAVGAFQGDGGGFTTEKVQGTPVIVTEDQAAKATDYLSKNWAKAVG